MGNNFFDNLGEDLKDAAKESIDGMEEFDREHPFMSKTTPLAQKALQLAGGTTIGLIARQIKRIKRK